MEKLIPMNDCPACENNDFIPFVGSNKFEQHLKQNFSSREKVTYIRSSFFQCQNCELLIAIDKVNVDIFRQKIAEGHYTDEAETGYAARTYFHLVKGFISPEEKSLEVGCSSGKFLELLNSKNTYGVEPNRFAHDRLNYDLKGRVRNQFLNDYSVQFSDKCLFDNIFSFQILEHQLDIADDMRQIKSLLKPGGQLFLVIHNYDSFINRVLKFKSPIYDYQHRYLFNERSIEALLQRFGFEIRQMRSILNYYPLSYGLSLLQKEFALPIDPIIPFPVGNLFIRAIRR